MKKLLILLAFAGSLTFTASAQNMSRDDNRTRGNKKEEMMRSPEERAERQTAHMAKKLRLTEAQQSAVYEANLAKAKQMQPIIDQARRNHGRMKEIRRQYDANMRETLTSDQYAQLEAMKADRKSRRMHRMQMQSNAPQEGYQPATDGMPSR